MSLSPESVLFQAFLISSEIFVVAKLPNLHQWEVKLTWCIFTTNAMAMKSRKKEDICYRRLIQL